MFDPHQPLPGGPGGPARALRAAAVGAPVRKSIRFAESPAAGQSCWPRWVPGAAAYRAIARELLGGASRRRMSPAELWAAARRTAIPPSLMRTPGPGRPTRPRTTARPPWWSSTRERRRHGSGPRAVDPLTGSAAPLPGHVATDASGKEALFSTAPLARRPRRSRWPAAAAARTRRPGPTCPSCCGRRSFKTRRRGPVGPVPPLSSPGAAALSAGPGPPCPVRSGVHRPAPLTTAGPHAARGLRAGARPPRVVEPGVPSPRALAAPGVGHRPLPVTSPPSRLDDAAAPRPRCGPPPRTLPRTRRPPGTFPPPGQVPLFEELPLRRCAAPRRRRLPAGALRPRAPAPGPTGCPGAPRASRPTWDSRAATSRRSRDGTNRRAPCGAESRDNPRPRPGASPGSGSAAPDDVPSRGPRRARGPTCRRGSQDPAGEDGSPPSTRRRSPARPGRRP